MVSWYFSFKELDLTGTQLFFSRLCKPQLHVLTCFNHLVLMVNLYRLWGSVLIKAGRDVSSVMMCVCIQSRVFLCGLSTDSCGAKRSFPPH